MKLIKDLGMIYPTNKSKQKKRYAIYQCDCGKTFKGCIHNERETCRSCQISKARKKYKIKAKENRLYSIWSDIKTRCYNEKNQAFKNYGAKGILMCDEWKNDFKAFELWSIQNGYEESKVIDKDILGAHKKEYSPRTCKWVSVMENTKEVNSRMNKNKIIGIRPSRNGERIYSHIKYNGKMRHLGVFDSTDEAIDFRNKYIVENKLENLRSTK